MGLKSFAFVICIYSASAGAGALAGSAQAATEIATSAAQSPQVFGWLEEVMLDPGHRWKIVAKLDTGADTSSLDAHEIRRVRVGNKRYVRFTVTDPESGEPVSLRRPYVRTVRIRQHDGDHERRRVVLMAVCLGDSERMIEVTLTDRAHFDYPMLLGRSALSGIAVVDPQLAQTTPPTCWKNIDAETDSESTPDVASSARQ